MKLSQIGRITKATILSLAIGLGMTACSSDYTIDYLYVTASRGTTGNISAYKIDSQSGSLTQIVDSPYSSGGRNPVAITVAPNNLVLFVLNKDDSSIVLFTIGTDGKIYPENTYTATSTTGTTPVAEAITPDAKFLAVAYTYQPGFSSSTPGPGGEIVVYPIIYQDGNRNPVDPSSSGIQHAKLGTAVTMGAVQYFPVGPNPVSMGFAPCTTLFPSCPSTYVPYLYVVEQTASAGTVLTLKLAPSTGVLSSVASTQAGVVPHAITEEPTGRFVYITDQSANQLIGYVVQSNGSLNPMVNGPFATGLFPQGITADPRGKFIYLTNYNNSTVSGYAIDPATGTPSGVFSNGVSSTGTGPTCVTVEPSQGLYLYTSNFVDNSVSGLQLDPHTGALQNIQNTPFNAAGNPTCSVTAATAGSHAYQAVQP